VEKTRIFVKYCASYVNSWKSSGLLHVAYGPIPKSRKFLPRSASELSSTFQHTIYKPNQESTYKAEKVSIRVATLATTPKILVKFSVHHVAHTHKQRCAPPDAHRHKQHSAPHDIRTHTQHSAPVIESEQVL